MNLIPLYNGLYNLQISLINNDIHNVHKNFLPYKVFIKYKKFKNKIANFHGPPIYNFTYKSINVLPNTEITPPNLVEEYKQIPIPQLLFLSSYKHLLENKQTFYTDASKTDSGIYVEFAFYSPSLKVQKLFRTYSDATIFTGEALAILQFIKYIISNNITEAPFLQIRLV